MKVKPAVSGFFSPRTLQQCSEISYYVYYLTESSFLMKQLKLGHLEL